LRGFPLLNHHFRQQFSIEIPPPQGDYFSALFISFHSSMHAITFRTLKASASTAVIGFAVVAGSLLSQQSPAQAQVIAPPAPSNPINFLPAYTTTGAVGGATSANPSSFGFFFEAAQDVQLDGLGFSSQPGWGNTTSYEVKLWSFDNGGLDPLDYTELATATFTHGTPYTFKDGYFWQSLAPVINLPESVVSDPTSLRGYVITAIGNFSGIGGNVEFEGGTATFDPRSINVGNGFNDTSDTAGFYPIPFYDGGIGDAGYFNANFSYVPGPLPVLGAAAGFGWTRRLRKRIRSSK